MNRLEPAFVESVRTRLAEDGGSAMAGGAPWAQRVAAAARAEGAVLGDGPMLDLVGLLHSEIVGLGPLAPFVHDPCVTDVLVHGPDQVWVDRGDGVERTGVRFRDEASVRRLAGRLAASAGRRLDDACPFVDVRLPDGIRLHALLSPIAVGGTCLSLRIPTRAGLSLDDWQASGALHERLAELLRAILSARLSFVVSGGTGSGKTTLLATLIGALPDAERVVVIEDTLELNPRHPHLVRLEARPANVEGAGAVTLRDLVRQALRMRPDRLIVGEVRGAEVVDLLSALNTGHDGGAGTLHANTSADVPARLEALALPAGLTRSALHSQLAAAVDAVVHLVRLPSGQRRVSEVGVTVVDPSGSVRVEPAWTVRADGELIAGRAADELVARLTGRGSP